METRFEPNNPGIASEAAGLTQMERVADAYVAPTRVFEDIRRSASWWLPFLLGIVVSIFFVYSVDRQIGFQQVAQANINRNAQQQQRFDAMPAGQREQAMHTVATVTRVISYSYPLVTLIFALIAAGILMVSFNFGLGGKGTFQQYFAVWFYAGLPYLIKYILAAIAIFAGASAQQFDMRNPVGTNIGWYLSSDVSQWVRTLLSSFDLFTIWVLVLLVLGCATVARVKRSSAAFVVVGWWLLIVFGSTIIAAFQG